MRSSLSRSLTVVAALALFLLPACKKNAPPAEDQTAALPANPEPAVPEFKVTTVMLGKAISAEKQVTAPTTSFQPKDTIYLAVATTGTAPSATLAVKWSYQDGKLVKADTQTISPTGPAATEFHISKPSGWPLGVYTVEVTANGDSVGRRSFQVTK